LARINPFKLHRRLEDGLRAILLRPRDSHVGVMISVATGWAESIYSDSRILAVHGEMARCIGLSHLSLEFIEHISKCSINKNS
jgi:hypothetical protein